jgi:ATP-dependent Clp protease adaptor protein ClpS
VTVLTTRFSRGVRLTDERGFAGYGRLPAEAGFIKMERLPAEAARGGRKNPGDGAGSGTAVITRTKTQTQRPSMYRVLLLNDDYTPMEFVVGVLCTFFHKTLEDAERIMWQVHTNGVGECGIYTYEVADTKVTQVMDHARKHQHPLQCVMEKK